MKPILITSGEPAGIGPDLCLDLSQLNLPIVVLGDPDLLQARAKLLGKPIAFKLFDFSEPFHYEPNQLLLWPIRCPVSISPGILNSQAAAYVLELLTTATQACLRGVAGGLVTAPVHKANINQGGFLFTGHTEFLAKLAQCQTEMLLVSDRLRVSLVTTHLPLKEVPYAITAERLNTHLTILYHSLQREFGIKEPRLKILGLNPHAGEGGHLGKEEQTIISPIIAEWQQRGLSIEGPFSADTAFLATEDCDAFVAMYHDQGLPVLKFSGFGNAVNVTCGLPFIRTSVDHGTALSLAGTGKALSGSMHAAANLAAKLARKHE